MTGEGEPAEAPLVVVHGETPIAKAVLSVGAALGYRTACFDDAVSPGGTPDPPVSPGGTPDPPVSPGGTPDPPGLADAAVVVTATHGGSGEEAVLRAALAAGVPYIGLVAGRSRGEAVVAGLGLDGDASTRIHTPAGLDIGAGTPEEVALAILAEYVSTRPRRPGQARAARGKRICDHDRSSPQ